MENSQYQEIARALIEAARRNRFLPPQLAVAPQLAEDEKSLLVLISGRIKDFAAVREQAALEQDEVQSLFTYVYARSAEAVTAWLGARPFMPRIEGMFNGCTPFEAEEKLIGFLKSKPLADCMYLAFSEWCEANPDFCARNDVHPLLPLLEALKWTFRIGAGLVIGFFERKAATEKMEREEFGLDG